METFNGFVGGLSQGRSRIYGVWGRGVDHRSQMDSLGNCRLDDSIGAGWFVSRTGVAMRKAGQA
jgi:hypothetical protein